MKINVLEESKKRIVIKVEGEDHTFCNSLKDELNNDKHVDAASYMIEHPLKNIPKMIVETDGSITPRQALTTAAQRLIKTSDKFLQLVKKEIK